jgi:hypothetical protein
MQTPSSLGPGGGDYIIPTTGYYDFRVAGAQGGPLGQVGGSGAIVGGELLFDAGDVVGILTGGAGVEGGGTEGYGGSGGGGSFVYGGSGGLPFAAGGGGGDGFGIGGGPGIGSGPGGHLTGPASYGGGGSGGAGGIGVADGPGIGGNIPPQQQAQAGSFPTAAQGRVATSGVDRREASAAAVAVGISAEAAVAALPEAALAAPAAIRL